VQKVGVIGLGKMGLLHFANCRLIDGVKVVAAADANKRALSRVKASGVGETFSSYQELLSKCPDLDAVIVSLPNFLHFDCIQDALESGVNVFVEKPLATTSKECSEIARKVETSGRKLMVGHCFRFLDAVEKIKAAADRGIVGNLEAITVEEVMNGPFAHGAVPTPVADWWFDPKKSGGGVLVDVGYHLIDLFRFFAGESEVVFSSIDHKFNLPVEDSAILILQSLDKSVKGIVNAGWYERLIFPKFDFRLILHGKAGYLSSEDFIPRNLYVHAAKEGLKNLFRKVTRQKIHPLAYTYIYEAHYKELRHFFECLRKDLEPSVSAIDGLRTIELIETAYAQAPGQSQA